MISFERNKLENLPISIIFSLLGHSILFYQLYAFHNLNFPDLPAQVVYSISIESNSVLGGITQVPEKDAKTEIAPPKKADTPSPAKEDDESKKEEVVIEKEKPKKETKEEVKKQPKPSPTPKKTSVPKTTPKPKVTPKPTKDQNYQSALQKYLGESTDAGGKGFGSTGQGTGKSMGGGVVKSPEWFRYRDLLISHVKKGWNWHDPSKNIIASVSFEIQSDGQVKNIKLVQTSGDSNYDSSVLRAVGKASPVPVPSKPEIYEDFKLVIVDFKANE